MTIKSYTSVTQTRNESLAQIHNAPRLDAATKVTVGKRNAVEQLLDNEMTAIGAGDTRP